MADRASLALRDAATAVATACRRAAAARSAARRARTSARARAPRTAAWRRTAATVAAPPGRRSHAARRACLSLASCAALASRSKAPISSMIERRRTSVFPPGEVASWQVASRPSPNPQPSQAGRSQLGWRLRSCSSQAERACDPLLLLQLLLVLLLLLLLLALQWRCGEERDERSAQGLGRSVPQLP